MRLDAMPASSRQPLQSDSAEKLDSNVLKQVSGGSLTGFLTGLLVSIFSRTLVLVIGLSIVVIQLASRYGIDLVKYLKLKDRARSSKILSALNENTPYKLSFGITFALSAFMQF